MGGGGETVMLQVQDSSVVGETPPTIASLHGL